MTRMQFRSQARTLSHRLTQIAAARGRAAAAVQQPAQPRASAASVCATAKQTSALVLVARAHLALPSVPRRRDQQTARTAAQQAAGMRLADAAAEVQPAAVAAGALSAAVAVRFHAAGMTVHVGSRTEPMMLMALVQAQACAALAQQARVAAPRQQCAGAQRTRRSVQRAWPAGLRA